MKKLIAIVILALIAFVNASYLTYRSHEIDTQMGTVGKIESSFCDVSNTLSCSEVLANPYAKIFGVPFTAVAMAVYPIIFAIAFLGIIGILSNSFLILTILGIGGTVFNSYFIYQEFVNIKAFCLLCILCSAIIIAILILSIIGLNTKKQIKATIQKPITMPKASPAKKVTTTKKIDKPIKKIKKSTKKGKK